MSRDVFKNHYVCPLTSTFFSKRSPQCHMSSSIYVSFQFLKCQLTCCFFLHKSHYMSKSKMCMSIDVKFIFVQVFACQNVKSLQTLWQKYTLCGRHARLHVCRIVFNMYVWCGILEPVFNIEVFNTCQMSFWPSRKFLNIFGTSQKCVVRSFHPSQWRPLQK